MKLNKFKIILLSFALVSTTSCLNELNTEPEYLLTLEQLLESQPNAANGLLAKVYASLSMSSAKGPGEADITGDDKGETVFLRGIINLEDFTADGMKNRWGDNGLDQLTTTTKWTSDNKFFRYLFDRVYYTVPQANALIDAFGKANISNKEQYIGELRFIRAFAYFYMIDCFGKGVIVTEKDLANPTPKEQASRIELFKYVESELLAIEPTIASKTEYGHVNKATVQMLLSRLYLNAQVYTGTARWNDAATYAKKVIDEGGYTLDTNFVRMFSADNNTSPEIIFPLIADPIGTQSYGNSTYIINGSTGGSPSTLNPALLGIKGDGWGGHRASKAWYGLFGNSLTDYNGGSANAVTTTPDQRGKLFWQTGHEYEMTDYKTWTDGYPSTKFRNLRTSGPSETTDFSGADFPVFRLSEAYLTYAECAIRGASTANLGQALTYMNELRGKRTASTINAGNLTLDFILAERAREFNLEGQRRTDLIRFDKFTGGSYLWPWKGGVKDGTAISPNYNVFPIPNTALSSNPNLTQNPGY
ncbi:RagB/SusD family nutrient uptake outer membrane protein [Chryseobacterium sp. G0162]|uniref:RagB/SusD family nutrient uptake outer membrane protein n=1 Tax=unclassified Chryseobacterium TaxID=2593645 RepID=UPI000F4E5F48|nr:MULTISPECIES: RagB/SusD family nutrient uptake outer membrane protein [unclassified Chryseobacterium]AZB07918.1 RagB/SusD family nutrient uptake outer membrane protein [Chryseobacterium sp. G0162]